jgi:hypothetical protein
MSPLPLLVTSSQYITMEIASLNYVPVPAVPQLISIDTALGYYSRGVYSVGVIIIVLAYLFMLTCQVNVCIEFWTFVD